MISTMQAQKDYVWRGSTLIEIHSVGPYDIVEFWQSATDNAKDKRRFRTFGTYIKGERTGHCYASIDEALAGCIAIRHEGRNTRADGYFIRSLGLTESQLEYEAPGTLSAHG